jgi:hypothetical protein
MTMALSLTSFNVNLIPFAHELWELNKAAIQAAKEQSAR